MNLPNLIRTKAEAVQLAAEFFPDEQAALAKLKPGTRCPRYQLTSDMAETLRLVLHWLYEQKPRIHKRARSHLFYELAHRLARQLDENGQAKIHEIYAEDRAAAWRNKCAAQTMTGDGDGI